MVSFEPFARDEVAQCSTPWAVTVQSLMHEAVNALRSVALGTVVHFVRMKSALASVAFLERT